MDWGALTMVVNAIPQHYFLSSMLPEIPLSSEIDLKDQARLEPTPKWPYGDPTFPNPDLLPPSAPVEETLGDPNQPFFTALPSTQGPQAEVIFTPQDVEPAGYLNTPLPLTSISSETYSPLTRNFNVPSSSDTMVPGTGRTPPYISSPFDKHVFRSFRSQQYLKKSIVTELKTNGDANNIFKKGYINKVLNTVLVPFNTINNKIYNDQTISLFINKGTSMIEKNLSQETKDAIKLVEESNIVCLAFGQSIKDIIYRAVISGNLDLYSPALLREIYDVGRSAFSDPIPSPVESQTRNTYNALTYITRNLRSLYAKNYPNDGDNTRFAAHWLTLPPEYQLCVSVTPREGAAIPIPVGLNFNFSVYETDGTERKINEFLDFFNILVRDGNEVPATERVVPLKSNRSKLYTINPRKVSRVWELLFRGEPGNVTIDRTKSSFMVSDSGESNAAAKEKGGFTVAGAYLLELDLATIKELDPPANMMRQYEANYNLVWQEGDEDSAFNDAIKVAGPHHTIYGPSKDPWWAYLGNSDAPNSVVKATFNCLNVNGYLPNDPDTLVASRIPQTILAIPSNKVKYNFSNGRSALDFESTSTRTFRMSPSPFIVSQTYVKPTKKSNEINLQGDLDMFALQFDKNLDEEELAEEVVEGVGPLVTTASPLGTYLDRVDNLKANYKLEYEGSKKLTQFDLYKGFTLNQLLELISIRVSDISDFTEVSILKNKKNDHVTPVTFISVDDLIDAESVPNLLNYIGSDEFPTIDYFL